MYRIVKFASLGVCATLLTGFVFAQNQQQNQQKGQQQNQTQQNQSGTAGQTTGQRGGYHGAFGQTPWFADQSVRQQLKFDDNQFNKLNKSYGESWQRYQNQMSELNKNKDLTDAQRAQRMSDLQREFGTNFSSTTNQIITDPSQRERYNQMYWQYLGYDAFNDPMVQQKLNLTDEQKQKLGQYSREWSTQMNDYSRGYATDREGTSKKFNESRKQANERINSILTKEQQQSWRQMVGDPYNFEPSVYFQTNSGQSNSDTSKKSSGQ